MWGSECEDEGGSVREECEDDGRVGVGGVRVEEE